MTAKPTERQRQMLIRTAKPGGMGTLAYGGHKGTYDALIRKGWAVEVSWTELHSRFGINNMMTLQITKEGREALLRQQ